MTKLGDTTVHLSKPNSLLLAWFYSQLLLDGLSGIRARVRCQLVLNSINSAWENILSLVSNIERIGSINQSLHRDNASDDADEEQIKINKNLLDLENDLRSSVTSDLDGSFYSMNSKEMLDHCRYYEKEESKEMKETPESEQEAFVIRPDDDRQFDNKNSSSIISTSKSSVGFIKDYYRIVELIKYRNLDKLKDELLKADSDVYGPIDMGKKTLLHYGWEFNSIDVWQVIIDILFKSERRKPIVPLKEFVNSSTTNGLTAIHFAAYRGNNRLLKYLISLGANVHWTDNDGHNWVHISAQADKINTIYFLLKNYKFDINKGDSKLSTALHWAAFLNKENALTYLLAWGANPNLQDIDNNTPLHLSVILSWKTGNTRNVKLLLLKGALRNIK